MGNDFRTALLYHMDKHQTAIVDLVKATGVSRHVINKIKAREGSSTDVENGLLIAAYYGKTLNQFVSMVDDAEVDPLVNLLELLSPAERQLLEAQILGLIARRDRK